MGLGFLLFFVGRCFGIRSEVSDLLECRQQRFQFTSFSSSNDETKEIPDVLFGLEIILSITSDSDPRNDAPFRKLSKGRGNVSSAHPSAFHDLVGAERTPLDEEESMNLGHRSRNAPGRAHLTPMADKRLARARQPRAGSLSRPRFQGGFGLNRHVRRIRSPGEAGDRIFRNY